MYEKLFKESTRLQTALSKFYAIVVKFCTKALEAMQEKGMKRPVKSLWKHFKRAFGRLEENINVKKEEVDEEIHLTSEQKQQQVEFKEAQTKRLQQLAEINENRIFRSQLSKNLP
ncbi:hypothetical protein MMC29_001491 [Sticta canariensis]|nr:hypothetical protein [Sticta canariensis]